MHDTVIRGGTIADGDGGKLYSGDVAINDGKISSVGGKAGLSRREIDADGLLVAPGWVDVHTHYDGQATWDPILAPSSWHGVTTAMFGNCGVGFAPVRKEDHRELIDLMEAIEEIPGTALEEGVAYDWESFPEFLDALERQPRAIDIAAQVPHHPLRVYVMGERAIRREPANATDIETMHELTKEALLAGAFGFTTSRTNSHKTLRGEFVPGRYSEVSELYGIGSALKGFEYGAFGMNSDFDDEEGELAWITELARETGRPVWFLITHNARDPERWKRLLKGIRKARNDGALVTGQVACRPVGVLLGVGATLNPFSARKEFQELRNLSPEERLERMRDPVVRDRILKSDDSDDAMERLSPSRVRAITRWDRMYTFGPDVDYEPSLDRCIKTIAARSNRTVEEVAYDYIAEGLDRFLYCPVSNYVDGDLASTREMLLDEGTLSGLSDGGAHCGSVVDASMPTYLLTHWARDRSRGPRLRLETVIKAQTSETADFFGFTDRGRLRPGLRADVNVIDHQGLKLHTPHLANDLPAGGRRLVQGADGYMATLVAGETVFVNGKHTGALPGRLVRAGRY
ncbi:MAG: N-acyl-D-aspartate deacylase [Alphaproteobacteria bacterium MarineAlpha4_Bin2]|nr:MAG: N-acyl-D-aspartate deacylase [Alphaproteobacteria bacterium MarineAlpha4_Bin2]